MINWIKFHHYKLQSSPFYSLLHQWKAEAEKFQQWAVQWQAYQISQVFSSLINIYFSFFEFSKIFCCFPAPKPSGFRGPAVAGPNPANGATNPVWLAGVRGPVSGTR